ncbi:MAG: hypothetical protein N0E44_15805 [Candidatus Thiodiazotropha lotti]|nr:hypothetical protein [Candidatus Thiodiazotropha lotti]MCW4221349.1 hypothetical protein [Candidatus Thiodiazotropha lotti]
MKHKDNEIYIEMYSAQHYKFYKKTGNPLYAWHTYNMFSSAELPIPEWVLEYLDQCTKNLLNLWDNPPKESAKSIANALNMVSPGRGSVFTDTSRRDLDIASHIAESLNKDPDLKPDQLYDSTAKYFGVSRSTVQRAWAEWRET